MLIKTEVVKPGMKSEGFNNLVPRALEVGSKASEKGPGDKV